jgi:hypothetical protein
MKSLQVSSCVCDSWYQQPMLVGEDLHIWVEFSDSEKFLARQWESAPNP